MPKPQFCWLCSFYREEEDDGYCPQLGEVRDECAPACDHFDLDPIKSAKAILAQRRRLQGEDHA